MGLRRLLFFATLSLATVATTGTASAAGEPQAAIAQVNQSRSGANLTEHEWLSQRARAHAESMRDAWVAAGCPSSTRGQLRHVSNLAGFYQPGKVHRSWTKVGENVGAIGVGGGDTGAAIRALHNAYMGSPGHKANIVDRRYTKIGVGVATGPTRSQQARGACPGVAPDSVLWNAQVFVAAPVK